MSSRTKVRRKPRPKARLSPKPRPRRRKRYLLIPAALLMGVAGYVVHRQLHPSRVPLPELGTFQEFQQDHSAALEMCRLLDLPELPNIGEIDTPGQWRFYEILSGLRERPDDADAYGRLGQLYQAQRFFQRAVQLYRRAIRMAPSDFTWHYALGLQLTDDGDLPGAEVAFRRASELNPGYPPVWMQRAWRAMDRNELSAAMEFMNRYIALRPNDPFGYVQRASIAFHLGEWDQMAKDLDWARSRGPIGKQGHRLLGILYKHLGRLDDSEFHLLMSAKEQPGGQMRDDIALEVEKLKTYGDPLIVRFKSLVKQERYREATMLADEVLAPYRDTPDYGLICDDISMCFRGINDYSAAYRYAEMARDALPHRPEGYVGLAFALGGMGRTEEALVQADRAVEIDPFSAPARYVRGVLLTRLAIREHRLDSRPDRPESRQRLLQAIDDLSRAVDNYPLYVKYLEALARACALAGQYDRADQLLKRAVRAEPGRQDLLMMKARVERREDFWPAPEGG